MKLSGVRLSVCLSVRPAQQAWITTVTLFLSTGFVVVGPAGRIHVYRSIVARPALSSKREQCHVVSWRRKLNANLLLVIIILCNVYSVFSAKSINRVSSVLYNAIGR